jgi:hypothetical protein
MKFVFGQNNGSGKFSFVSGPAIGGAKSVE